MRTRWCLLLLVAGLARAEAFPLRSGGAVTGELDLYASQVDALWIAALVAAGVVSVFGALVQGGRWARREGASVWLV